MTVPGQRRIERLLSYGGSLGASPTPVAPFHRLDMTFGGHGRAHSRRMYVVPSSALLRSSNSNGEAAWARLAPGSRLALRKLVGWAEPFPPPRVTEVAIGDKRVTGDPTTYLQLFTLPALAEQGPAVSDWVPVDLRAATPSPWTDGRWDLAYSPKEGVLERGAWLLALPDDLADDLAAGRSIVDEGNPFPWTTVLAIGVLGALGLAAAMLPTRRMPRLQPRSK